MDGVNTFIISLGSNVDGEENIGLCRALLCDLFDDISFSETSVTKPFGDQYKDDFLNQLALVHTDQTLDDCIYNLKLIEKQIGRTLEDKVRGEIKIDADIVKWNDDVLKDEDWGRSYIADLLPSLYRNAI